MTVKTVRQMKTMARLGAILNNPRYQEYYAATVKAEATRIYCQHNAQHYADVARCAYIMWLNGEVACPELEPYHSDTVREIIYTAAFLHDIGRFMEYADKSLDHALESEKLSRPFLQEAGFSRAEAELILKAIKNHRQANTSGFDLLIYRADKESRLCSLCPVRETCKKFQDKAVPDISI